MSVARRHRLLTAIAMIAGIALLVASATALARHRAVVHRYDGKTEQGFRLRVSAKGQRIYLVRFKAKLRCHDGSLLYDDLSDFEATRLRRGGRFADLQFGPSDEVQWQGRLRGGRVRGSLRVRDKLKNGVSCDSGTVRFGVRQMG